MQVRSGDASLHYFAQGATLPIPARYRRDHWPPRRPGAESHLAPGRWNRTCRDRYRRRESVRSATRAKQRDHAAHIGASYSRYSRTPAEATTVERIETHLAEDDRR